MTDIDLTSPEVKAAIAEAVAAEVSGLKAKNAELIQLNKKLRAQSEIKPEDLEAVEKERDELRDQLKEAKRTAEKATKELDLATKRAQEIDAQFSRTLSDSALTDVLTKAGVTNPVHLKAAKAMLAAAVQVAEENGTRVVKAGDKALADFVSEWAAGEEGKHFIAAPSVSGSGASPSNKGGGPINKKASEMSASEKAAFISENGIERWQQKVETDYRPAPR